MRFFCKMKNHCLCVSNGALLLVSFVSLSFIYPIQVLFQSQALAVIPYIPIALSLVLSAYRSRGRIQFKWISNPIDWFAIFLVLQIFFTTTIGFCSGKIEWGDFVRISLVYVLSSWFYFYYSRDESGRETEHMISAIAICAAISALLWIIDTYLKTILYQTTSYQYMSFKYIEKYNNFSTGGVNNSLLSPGNRAYGTFDKYTTTGAFVALGAYAALYKTRLAIVFVRFFVFIYFFLSLFIGMATTALLTFMLALPVYFFVSKCFSIVLFKRNLFKIMPFVMAIIVGSSFFKTVLAFEKNTLYIMKIQFSFFINFNGHNAPISFYKIFCSYTNCFVNYVQHSIIISIFGQGFAGIGQVNYPLGGDVAIYEFIAVFGILLFVAFVAVLVFLLREFILLKRLNGFDAGQLMFAFPVILCLVLSLVHYDAIFNKEIFAIFYFSLGVASRALNRVPKICINGPDSMLLWDGLNVNRDAVVSNC